MPKRKDRKRKAQPKLSTATPGPDSSHGLWVDYELLRKHHGRPFQWVNHQPASAVSNHYLELADLALGSGKPKKKSKGVAPTK